MLGVEHSGVHAFPDQGFVHALAGLDGDVVEAAGRVGAEAEVVAA